MYSMTFVAHEWRYEQYDRPSRRLHISADLPLLTVPSFPLLTSPSFPLLTSPS